MENCDGDFNYQFLLSLMIIALGYFIKRLNIVKTEDSGVLSSIILNITLPALVIKTFSTVEIDFALGILPLINIAYGAIMVLVALLAFRKEKRQTRGVMSMVLPGMNIGIFMYPLAEFIWGQDAVRYFAMFDMGNAIILFGACYSLAAIFSTDEKNKIDVKYITKKLTHSIPLIVYMLTLAINLAGLKFPAIIIDVSSILSRANMPLSFLLLGIVMDFSLDKSQWKMVIKVLSIRYGIGLATGILLYLLLPYGELFGYTMLLGFVLPIGMAVIPYSIMFKYNQSLVGTMVNLTNIISFVLIWAAVNMKSFM